MFAKSIVTVALGLLAIQANAESGLYTFGSVGEQHLRYDWDGWLAKKSKVGNTPYYLEALDLLGGKIENGRSMTSLSYKAGFGYKFSDKNAMEVSYRRFGPSEIHLDASIPEKSGSFHGSYAGYTVQGSAAAEASASLSATAWGKGLGVSYLRTVGDSFFVRGGVEYAIMQTKQVTIEHYSYSYNASVDGPAYSNSVSGGQNVTTTNVDYKQYKQFVPLLGVGMDFPLTKSFTLRAEIEHVGIVKYGFDFAYATVIYKF